MPAQQEPYPLERLPLAKVSCLALLALPPGDLDELRRQGFVSREMRGGRTRFRLRYRRRGRQVALDLGSQPWLAQNVARELAELQADCRRQRRHKRLIGAARRLLRTSKRVLAPVLGAAGYEFHGHEIRRTRRAKEVPADVADQRTN